MKIKPTLFILFTFLIHIPLFAWTPVEDNYLYVTAICADSSENTVYIGLQCGGVWRTRDNGLSWEPMNETLIGPEIDYTNILLVEDLNVLDAAADTITARVQFARPLRYQYLISMDTGESWIQLRPPYPVATYSHFFIRDKDDTNVWYLVTPSRFYKITDFGETWEEIQYDPRGNQKAQFFQDSEEDSTFYIAGAPINSNYPSGLWKSNNNGLNWSPIISANFLLNRDRVAVYDFDILSNGDYLLTCPFGTDHDYTNYRFYHTLIRSENRGQSAFIDTVGLPNLFVPSEIMESSWYPGTVFVRETDINNSHGLYCSTDYGHNFEHCLNGLPPEVAGSYRITENPFNGNLYYCTTGRGVWKSEDGGDSWSEFEINLPLGRPRVFSIHEDGIYTRGFSDRFIEKYTPDTNEWTTYDVPASDPDTINMLSYITLNDGETVYSILQKQADEDHSAVVGAAKQETNGDWSYYGEVLYPDTASNYYGPEILRGYTKTWWAFYYPTENGQMACVSPDSGRSWNTTPCSIIPYFGIKGDTLLMSNRDPMVRYSVDDGVSWHDFGVNAGQYIKIYEHNEATGELYMLSNDSLFIRSSEGIERYRLPIKQLSACIIPGENPVLIITTYYSNNDFRSIIRVSYDGGRSWGFDELLEDTESYAGQGILIDFVKYDPWRDLVWASTSFGLLYKPANEYCSVPEDRKSMIPSEIKSFHAYPNPFNETSVVSFDINKQTDVSLVLYDLMGRRVMDIYRGMVIPGRHEHSINGKDLASGMYFLKIESESTSQTLKMSLIK